MEFLQWVENLAFSTWIRESGSIWGYAMVLTLHTIGLAILVGVSFAVDLRLLGFGKEAQIGPYERYFPIMWIGFWVNAISGVILLMADATTKMINPVFYVKMAFIFLAVWNVRIVSWVPGSPMDWAATMPTASPSSMLLPVASERP